LKLALIMLKCRWFFSWVINNGWNGPL